MIVTGSIDIDFETLVQAADMIVTPDCPPEGHRFGMFKKVAEAAKKDGSLLMGQVAHAGRQTTAVLNPNPISASDVQLRRLRHSGFYMFSY
jgi:2,4-dienoyl-CoA reductase-like NADH-dependent reductase (Old Yellow Enzyme family)